MKKHNFNKINLLRNNKFYFVAEDDTRVDFTVPTLEDYLDNEMMMSFFSLLQVDYQKALEEPINNHLELLYYCLKNQLFVEEIVTTLHLLIKEPKVMVDKITIGDHVLSIEEFDWLKERWLISLGVMNFDLEMTQETDEQLSEADKKLKAAEEKLRKIKQKKQENLNEGKGLQLDMILAAVMKEFKMTLPDLLSMTLYAVFFYYQLCLRYNNYRIETIAYGNGLIKQHKYFID